MLVWRMLWFGRDGVTVFGEDVSDVPIHGEAACLLGVVPREVDAGKFRACPIGGHFVGFLEGGEEMVGVSSFAVFDSKVIHNEDKDDGAPLMAP